MKSLHWKSTALACLAIIPMLAAHTINTSAERNSALAQLRVMKQMQTAAHHNRRTQTAAMNRPAAHAPITVTECNPRPRTAIKLAGYTWHPPAQLALNFAAHDSGSWPAALTTQLQD